MNLRGALCVAAAMSLTLPADLATAHEHGSPSPLDTTSSPSVPAEAAPPEESRTDPAAAHRIAARAVLGTVEVTEATGNGPSAMSVPSREVVAVTWSEDVPQFTTLRAPRSSDVPRVISALRQEGVPASPNSHVQLADHDGADVPANTEPRAYQQSNLDAIHAPAAWAVTRGKGVVVAVLDTGVDPTQLELAGRVLPAIDLTGSPLAGDPQGHGTKVSTLMAASIDRRGIAGVAPMVRILPVRILDETGSGDTADVAEGIKRAVLAGARVVNASLGGDEDSEAVRAAVEFARTRGVLVIAAAGNDGDGLPVEFPAADPSVLAVASVSYEADTGGFSRSYFSNAGPEVDLAAPGEGIPTASVGGQPPFMSGTSAATPHVAGVAALVAAANPVLSGEEIAAILLQTAEDGESPGRDTYVGAGMVRADHAVMAAAQLPGGSLGPKPTHRITAPAAAAGGAAITAAPPTGSLAVLSATAETQQHSGSWSITPAGTPFSLQFRPSGKSAWQTMATGVALRNGVIRARARILGSGRWRFSIQGSRGRTTVIKALAPSSVEWRSPAVGRVNVRSGSSTTMTARAVLVFPPVAGGEARTLPAAPGMSFQVQFKRTGGAWRTVATRTVRTAGVLAARIAPRADGRWRFKLGSRTGPAIYVNTFRS